MFAYSGPARDLSPFLVGPDSLEALACEHSDGWGVATWENGLPRVLKEPAAADDPKSGWRDAVLRARGSHLVVAHIRKASAGRAARENTHPFEYGNWVFAHNGTVEGMADRRKALLDEVEPRIRAAVKGSTDSEAAFALFLHRLLALPEGLRASIDDAAPSLVAVARRLRREMPGLPDRPTRTTFLAGNGEGVVGHRWLRDLSVLQGDGWAAIASEPLGPPPESLGASAWREVPDGATVFLQGGRVRVRVP